MRIPSWLEDSDDSKEAGGWYRAQSALLFLTLGVSWPLLGLASWLSYLLHVVTRRDDRTAGYSGDDL